MSEGRILVAGIGNVFLGDDGFGVAVAHELLRRGGLGPGVDVEDFGIRGFDLAYRMLGGYREVILVDAVPRGDAPGTVYVIEADLDAQPDDGSAPDGHLMTPDAVFRLVRMLGGRGGCGGRVHIVGCEPQTFGEENIGHMGLSDTVRAAVAVAVEAVENLTAALLREPATLGGEARA